MQSHPKITELLEKGFTTSVEMFPPRNGKDPDMILKKLERVSRLGVDFVSITKGAMGSHRGGTLPIGYLMEDRFGLAPLVHFRCRDYSKAEVENSLVDHMYLGIRNILAVLGDPLKSEPSVTLDPGTHHVYASRLVTQITEMNNGRYLKVDGKDNTGVPADFCIGVACYPEREDMGLEMTIMGEKAAAGADFAITQMFFDADAYTSYIARLRENGVDLPVIPGIRPVMKREHLITARDVFGARLPVPLAEALEMEDDDEVARRCMDHTVRLCKELKNRGAPGLHMFILNNVSLAEKVVGALND